MSASTPHFAALPMHPWVAWLASASNVEGNTPERALIWASIGVTLDRSLPTLFTRRPTMVHGPPDGEPATANCTLYPGREPPSGIFITRASGSVVDARKSFPPA